MRNKSRHSWKASNGQSKTTVPPRIDISKLAIVHKIVMEFNPDEILPLKHGMIINSQLMRDVLSTIEKIAKVNINVLITGESGTGKEQIAKAIHSLGGFNKPMSSLNLAGLPEYAFETTLFGTCYNAHSTATEQAGYFEMANGTTIFLDEIGDLPIYLQVKILRVIQERIVDRVGGIDSSHVFKNINYPSHKNIQTDFRLISATNQPLEKLIECGQFREDLYYRIGELKLTVPPIRERIEEVPWLIKLMIEK
jgi:transcriptional regulator with PAS, ATPase and Fis domain